MMKTSGLKSDATIVSSDKTHFEPCNTESSLKIVMPGKTSESSGANARAWNRQRIVRITTAIGRLDNSPDAENDICKMYFLTIRVFDIIIIK